MSVPHPWGVLPLLVADDALSGRLGGTYDYRATVAEARDYFNSPEATGPHVSRWVMNCHAMMLDLALQLEDTDQAAVELQSLTDGPWLQENGLTHLLTSYQAKQATLTGDWMRAIELFTELLSGQLTDPPPPREQMARDLYYYGRALAGSGDSATAREMWELGLRCPANAANWPWQPRIRSALSAMGK